MTGRDRQVLDDLAVERLLTGRERLADPALVQAVAQLRTLADGPAPPPTAALAEMLERGFEPTVVPLRRPGAPRRRWAARTGTAVAVAAASVLVAGSAAALPPALQDTVADLVAALTPFDLPRSTPEPDPRPTESVPAEEVRPSEAPAPSAVPTPGPAHSTAPASPTVDHIPPATGPADVGTDGPAVERQPQAAEESQKAAAASGTATGDANAGGEAAGSAEGESARSGRP
jgi:hypothetical protein